MGELYTIPEYAKRVKVSRTMIYKWEKNGQIKFVLDGKKKMVDAAQADPVAKYYPAGRAVSKVNQKNGQKNKGTVKSQPVPAESELPELTPDASHDDLDKIKLYEQARKLRLDNDAKEKILINGDEARNTFFEVARNIRNAVEAVAPRITPIIVGMNAHDMEQELKKEMNKVLMNLSEEILK